METKELMQGDLLYSRKRKSVCKVEGYYLGKIHITDSCGWFVGKIKDLQIEPIILTEEILKANGWKVLSNFDRETYYSDNGEFNLDVHNGKLRLIIHSNVVIMEYVHQLQHALHLCGLNELADNIKI